MKIDYASIIPKLVEDFGEGLSLTSGLAGLYYFLHKINLPEITGCYIQEVESKLIDGVNNSLDSLNYADGLAGIAFAIHECHENKEESNEFLNEIDGILAAELDTCIHNLDIDFFWGGTGISFYLLNRNKQSKTNKQFLELIMKHCDILDSQSFVNLTFAHGLMAVIQLLRKAKSVFVNEIDKFDRAITKCICFLFKVRKRFDLEQLGPIFYSDKKKHDAGRLAWCQGDLAFSLLTIQYAKEINNKELFKRALDVSYDTLKRDNLESAQITDTSFCHGTATLIQFYNKIYTITQDKVFERRAKEWLQKSFENGLVSIEDGKMKTKVMVENETGDRYFKDDNSLSMGKIGFLLAVRSLDDKSIINWDKVFLM